MGETRNENTTFVTSYPWVARGARYGERVKM